MQNPDPVVKYNPLPALHLVHNDLGCVRLHAASTEHPQETVGGHLKTAVEEGYGRVGVLLFHFHFPWHAFHGGLDKWENCSRSAFVRFKGS